MYFCLFNSNIFLHIAFYGMDEESGAVCTGGIVSHKDVTRISPESDSHNLSGPPLASSLYDLKLNE